MAEVKLVGVFRTIDGSETRTHVVDVTDCVNECLADGMEYHQFSEDFVDREARKIGWSEKPDFIHWQEARLVP